LSPENRLILPDTVAPELSGQRERGPRLSLHEFQARLLDRMAAARDGVGMRDSRLGVMIGEQRCLLDLREAGEIVPPMPVTAVPLTKDWYLGLANIRGNLVGIVDLQRFHGGALQTWGKESRIVVFAAALSASNALLVSRVLGLRHIGDMVLQEPAKYLSIPGATHAYLDQDKNEWVQIGLRPLLADPLFMQVGR